MQHVSQQLYHLSHQISCYCFSSKSINYSINYLQNSWMHWSASGGNGTSDIKKKRCKLSLFTRYTASSVQDRNQNRTTHQATSTETRRTTKWIRGLGSVKQHAIEKKGGKDKCLRTQVVLDGLWMLDLYKKKKGLLVDMLTVSFLSTLDQKQTKRDIILNIFYLVHWHLANYSCHRLYSWFTSWQYRLPIFPHCSAWRHKSSLAHLWASVTAIKWELQQELALPSDSPTEEPADSHGSYRK